MTYLVYAPQTATSLSRATPVMVRAGFSWAAFFWTLPWLLYHRLFMEAWIYIAVVTLFFSLVDVFSWPLSLSWLWVFCLSMAVGWNASFVREWSLLRRGYQLEAVASINREETVLAEAMASFSQHHRLQVPQPLADDEKKAFSAQPWSRGFQNKPAVPRVQNPEMPNMESGPEGERP